jgi:hypothetical protein
MRCGHTDLIDPQLWARMVRVNVVNCGHETNHLAVLDSHHQMVARVYQKLVGPLSVDRVVKHIRRNVRENARALRA